MLGRLQESAYLRIMICKRLLLSICCASLWLACHAGAGDDAKAAVRRWMEQWEPPMAYTSACKLEDFRLNARARTIIIEGAGGFMEQFFTEELVEQIYASVREALPEAYRGYSLTVKAEGVPIEDLVPNALRDALPVDRTRQWSRSYEGNPWVRNDSRPYTPTRGLEGEHIALWQSHGRYWSSRKRQWEWQRPRLYCTCEDLFTQSFIIPFLIPMLENAGAVVWTPRERDYQQDEVILTPSSPQTDGYFEADGDKARWTPRLHNGGRYAVYVRYPQMEGATDRAVYRVHHLGGVTQLSVNQRMGGGTWTYLGTYDFPAGATQQGMVELERGKGVSIGDVRFGGGMGSTRKGAARTTSGLPRWAEAARYTLAYWGLPDSVTDYYEGADDYKSDILSRPIGANHMAGGSLYVPEREGLGVPFSLALALHSDAGVSKTNECFGSLSVCTTETADGHYTQAGLNRYASHDLSAMLLNGLRTDLAAYGWHVRKLWNKNYAETRVPQMPSAILEMLSHQNFRDLQLGYDPIFKFQLCRSVYKTIVKWEASMHQRPYTIQPLPVRAMSTRLEEQRGEVVVSWQPTHDPLEPTAEPEAYILYVRTNDGGWDNGTLIKGTQCAVRVQRDVLYSFRVSALNDGGESFPSEVVCASISSRNDGSVLIVNGFTRLSGPASVDNARQQGFLLDQDPGVPYGAFTGFCGAQINLDRSLPEGDDEKAHGWSGSELEGKTVMGNTFDYARLHGQALAQQGRHSFASVSAEAFVRDGLKGLRDYAMVDVFFGTQKEVPDGMRGLLQSYLQGGGKLLLSGANMLTDCGLNIPEMHASLASRVRDNRTNLIRGSGAEFTIYRSMNAESYAVPSVEALTPRDGAFAMLVYNDNTPAATAYSDSRYRCVTMGFPLEAISNAEMRGKLLRAVAAYLTAK